MSNAIASPPVFHYFKSVVIFMCKSWLNKNIEWYKVKKNPHPCCKLIYCRGIHSQKGIQSIYFTYNKDGGDKDYI